jgi:heterodisulfide reductase subunit B
MSAETQKTLPYYPGCSMMVTNKAYDVSSRNVAKALGVELAEIEDWNCCGATAYLSVNEKVSFVLSARNLALVEAQANGEGPQNLVTVCSGCFVALRKANKYMDENAKLRNEIRDALKAGGMDYAGGVSVRHFLEVVVNDLGEDAVRSRVERPLSGLKVAPYSGCQIGRPFTDVEDPEFPTLMDRLLQWLGAEVVDFPFKAKCCGGMMMTTQRDLALQLTGKVLQNAGDSGADCIATACPLCQINLEGYQKEACNVFGKSCDVPIFYFTQLMGIAFGLDHKELALAENLTSPGVAIAGRGR